MNRHTLTLPALVFTCMLAAMSIDAAAQSQSPELTEKQLEQRCEAAIRDLRTFCSHEIRPQAYTFPMNLDELLSVQQPAPSAPDPGSQQPELPGSKAKFDCLDARLRVDRYCYREKPATGQEVDFNVDSRAPRGRI